MAVIALFATDLPNVGPISETSGCPAMPNLLSSARTTWFVRPDLASEICTTLSPSSGFLTVWICASPKSGRRDGAPDVAHRRRLLQRCGDARADSKSMPKFRPLTAIAIVQTSRIAPDMEKNHFDAPMKSKVMGFWLPGAGADGFCSSRVPRIESRIAWVARTAVKSDTIVPTPSTNAKPLTPAVKGATSATSWSWRTPTVRCVGPAASGCSHAWSVTTARSRPRRCWCRCTRFADFRLPADPKSVGGEPAGHRAAGRRKDAPHHRKSRPQSTPFPAATRNLHLNNATSGATFTRTVQPSPGQDSTIVSSS